MPSRHALAVAILTVLAALPATAQQAEPTSTDPHADHADHEAKAKALAEIVVTAVPGAQSADELVTPVAVLAGEALDDARHGTLGQTVAGLLGVQTTAFGEGVGRPVIRGLDGARVSILANGQGAQDVSAVSQDHAVTIEPFLADQVEILKGPSTLLYGSGAIGGVVNVVDGRIATTPVDRALGGRVEYRHDSVSDGDTAMFRLDGGDDRFALHADALWRDTGDYDAADRTVANSFVKTRTGAVGGSWFIGDGYVGLAVSRYRNEYGNPAEPGDEEEAGVRLDMEQTRYDLKTGWRSPWQGVDDVSFALSHTDYEHTEFEGDEVGTVFGNDADEARAVVTLSPLAQWQVALGVQAFDRSFAAVGDETFVPPTTARGVGVFVTGQREIDAWTIEVGARGDRQRADPDNGDARRFDPLGVSAGLAWRFATGWHLSLNLDRAQRAPAEEELFADGPHIASATFEVGDPTLDVETANQVEVGLHYHGDLFEAKAAVYASQYDDFIYLADTGEIEDDLPVRVWTQDDARFRGAEAELIAHAYEGASGHLDLRLWGDTVRARLRDGGGDLPRIPASRVGAAATWTQGAWRASLGATRYAEQDRVAAIETPTDGFTLVDARVAWTFVDDGDRQWQAFANALNLTDQDARLSTSLIKDDAPLPGRNVQVGIRGTF